MDDIINSINNNNLSLDELREIVKVALSKTYSKIETEIGIYSPSAYIKSIGGDSYDVEIIFIENNIYSGNSYTNTYCI